MTLFSILGSVGKKEELELYVSASNLSKIADFPNDSSSKQSSFLLFEWPKNNFHLCFGKFCCKIDASMLSSLSCVVSSTDGLMFRPELFLFQYDFFTFRQHSIFGPKNTR